MALYSLKFLIIKDVELDCYSTCLHKRTPSCQTRCPPALALVCADRPIHYLCKGGKILLKISQNLIQSED